MITFSPESTSLLLGTPPGLVVRRSAADRWDHSRIACRALIKQEVLKVMLSRPALEEMSPREARSLSFRIHGVLTALVLL